MKTFRVESVDWIDEVEVDETVWETYESQAQEAISSSLERWLQSDDDHMIGVLTVTWDVSMGQSEESMFIMNNEHVFQNIGRLDMAQMITEVLDTPID